MKELDYINRIKNLAKTKAYHTKIKWQRYGKGKDPFTLMGAFDKDDKGLIPPPLDFKFKINKNHPSGGVFGAKAVGKNFRRLLEAHPVYIDSMSSLAGGYMFDFRDMCNHDSGRSNWNPDFDYSHLHDDQKRYDLVDGIGGPQHFCQDINIGFDLGWKGILDKINLYRNKNIPEKKEFYDALEGIVLGIQNLINRHAQAAREAAGTEERPELKQNLLKMAEVNERLVTDPPQTFYEAVQWFAWYIIVSLMFNNSGSGGAIDQFLKPYYDSDKAAGILTDEEAMFHLACLLVKDNQYYQIGGTDKKGNDITNPLSFMVLEAAHLLRIPTSIYVRVHEKQDEKLLEVAVKYLFKDKNGSPNFISDKNMNEGFIKNGFSIELARQRVKCGCHWCAIPGREYSLNDCIKINLAKMFEAAFEELINDKSEKSGIDRLWNKFSKHLEKAIKVIAKGIDFHMEHMHKVFPELVLDLLCHGPIEKGLDVTNKALDFYNFGIDSCSLATIADSFAAIEQRVEDEKCITWEELKECLDTNFENTEDKRIMLKNVDRFGSGMSKADHYAVKISEIFTELVKRKPTPNGFNMIPGIFSWANTVSFGFNTKATPNGRFKGQPISHGANPGPGFEGSDAITAYATAVASVQPGYGNTAPLQIDLDPLIATDKEDREKFIAFIKGFFDLGGTLLNVNILDKDKILEANKNPQKYPELIVRVTGFSTYFASLSDEWRKVVIDRIVQSY